MNLPRYILAAGLCLGLSVSLLHSGPIPSGKPATYPDWWFERDVIPRLPTSASKSNPGWPLDYPAADDYAVANIGQLKAISIQAANAMDYAYLDGVPASLRSLLNGWRAPLPTSGLAGTYFNNTTLSGFPALTRHEGIDFDWGADAPDSSVSDDSYSVRWTGYFIPSISGSYTFQTNSDDGVRLWVGDDLLIENWTTHGATTDQTPAVTLVAGTRYPIKLEYFEDWGDAVIQLQWLVPGESDFSTMPPGAFYSLDGYSYEEIKAYLASSTVDPKPDDFAAVNQGQLKYVASLFYQRLAELGYQGAPLSIGQTRPWTTNTTSDDDDYALVNLGQLKRIFSFSLSPQSVPDSDGDGLSDAEETAFGSIGTPDTDFDHDGYADAADAFPADPAKHTYTGTLSVTLLAPSGATLLP